MHNEEAEAILYREVLEGDGTVEALRGDVFSPVLIRDDGGSILLFQRDLDGFIVRLWVSDNAMICDRERCQEIWWKEEWEEGGKG